MIIEGRYLDEILRELYKTLTASTDIFDATKGSGQDLLAPTIVLLDPRSRISSTAIRGRLISALGEFCWYMSGSDSRDFIEFYITDYPGEDDPIQEAYGPRLMRVNQPSCVESQLYRVIKRLERKPDTRRAVITILETGDLGQGNTDAPCTVALQFIRRRERIHMVTMMRSNDAYLGFPHDVFCFTMIQELVARALGDRLGEYHHFTTSMHLYECDKDNATAYLAEGFQNPKFSMPAMPRGCQRANMEKFLVAEEKIRNGTITDAKQIKLPVYWKDLSLILLRRADGKFKRGMKVLEKNFSNISNDYYRNLFHRKPQFVETDGIIPEDQGVLDLEDKNAIKHK